MWTIFSLKDVRQEGLYIQPYIPSGRRATSPQFHKFGQNQNFLGSDKEIFGQNQKFLGSNRKIWEKL